MIVPCQVFSLECIHKSNIICNQHGIVRIIFVYTNTYRHAIMVDDQRGYKFESKRGGVFGKVWGCKRKGEMLRLNKQIKQWTNKRHHNKKIFKWTYQLLFPTSWLRYYMECCSSSLKIFQVGGETRWQEDKALTHILGKKFPQQAVVTERGTRWAKGSWHHQGIYKTKNHRVNKVMIQT